MDDEQEARIASAGSVVAGFLASAGWWVFLAAIASAGVECLGNWNSEWRQRHVHNCTDFWTGSNATYHPQVAVPPAAVSGAYRAAGILSSFGLVGLNAISWEAVVEEGGFGDGVNCMARVWTMASLVLLFSGLGTAIW